jgi:pentapeptide MXKDX repeat protein
MKKLLTLLFAAALTLSLSAGAFAQDTMSQDASKDKKEAKAEKKAAKKKAKKEKKAAKEEKKDEAPK